MQETLDVRLGDTMSLALGFSSNLLYKRGLVTARRAMQPIVLV
jgi:hypothetical protein